MTWEGANSNMGEIGEGKADISNENANREVTNNEDSSAKKVSLAYLVMEYLNNKQPEIDFNNHPPLLTKDGKEKEATEIIIEMYKPLKNLTERVHGEEEQRQRHPFVRDYQRIESSSDFRRLRNKMQRYTVKYGSSEMTRYSHSVGVAKLSEALGRRIGRAIFKTLGHEGVAKLLGEEVKSWSDELRFPLYLSPEDLAVLKFASYAHDIGNPPFGHKGERTLHELTKDIGGFEGNAQTLRIILNLNSEYSNFKGINPTWRSLLSVIKYFKTHDGPDSELTKFLYKEDFKVVKDGLNSLKADYKDLKDLKIRTLDMQIIDLIDDIHNVTYDLIDGLSLKVFTIDEILDFLYRTGAKDKSERDQSERDKSERNDIYDAFSMMVDHCREKARKRATLNTPYDTAFRKELEGILVNMFLTDVGLKEVDEKTKQRTGTSNEYELSLTNFNPLMDALSEAVSSVAYDKTILHYEKIGSEVLEKLFSKLVDVNLDKRKSESAFNEDFLFLPPRYRPSDSDLEGKSIHEAEEVVMRHVADYLSSLQDFEAITLYNEIFSPKSSELRIPDILYEFSNLYRRNR